MGENAGQESNIKEHTLPYHHPLLACILLILGCTLSTRLPPTATPVPTATSIPTPVEPGSWQPLSPGIETRTYHPPNAFLGQLWIVRIDPAQYTFCAHYRPGEPLHLSDWQAELSSAAVFVNANFFDPDHTINGLLIADGVPFGESYQGRGGTFLVQNGQPRVRSNITEPYYPGEPIEQAVQAFPMLVVNGQASFVQSGQVSRRTVVAQDAQGRILLMVTPLTGLSLDVLSAYLPTTDLSIVNALNLDGGGSTMIFADSDLTQSFRLPSFDPVPAVLAVYPR
jgi:uncharacterized protein YigE (DUF2233 family)